MMEYLIYVLMAWEAMQSTNPLIAYINATGGGIIRSSMLGVWSSNISTQTILSILFWNFISRLIKRHNILITFRSKLSKIKPTISSISTVCFGFYGLSVAPTLGWFAYYITACGGGIISTMICSKNKHQAITDIFVRTIWTFIEGVLISTTSFKEFQLFGVVIFIVLREVYYHFEGRNLVECINYLIHLHIPTNIGIPIYKKYMYSVSKHQSIHILRKPQIRMYGSLCRRHIVQAS